MEDVLQLLGEQAAYYVENPDRMMGSAGGFVTGVYGCVGTWSYLRARRAGAVTHHTELAEQVSAYTEGLDDPLKEFLRHPRRYSTMKGYEAALTNMYGEEYQEILEDC